MWVIMIRNEGVEIDQVGPFDAECVADMFCAGFLEPAMPECKFHITELASPQSIWESLGKPIPQSGKPIIAS